MYVAPVANRIVSADIILVLP